MLFAGHQIMVQFRYKMHELHLTSSAFRRENVGGKLSILERIHFSQHLVFHIHGQRAQFYFTSYCWLWETVTAWHDADDTEPFHVLRAQRLFYSDSSPIIVLPLQLTDWLTNSYLVNLIDVALASEDANPKLVVL